jgi:predicted metal-binding membrane protein
MLKASSLDRAALWGGVALVVAASWGWLFYQSWAMRHMDVVDMPMPSRGAWSIDDLALIATMWGVMMVAMMLPTVVPMLVVYRRLLLVRPPGLPPATMTGAFAIGYLAAWVLFSIAAALVHWGLHTAAVISPPMTITIPLVGGAVLVAAGIYQWTPAKVTCLAHCRAPLVFLVDHWRRGLRGALGMGFRHGLYCMGCCVLLMAVLFVVGVMNLLWVAAITLFVLAEKALPGGAWLGRASGLALIAWGGWVLYGALAPTA